MKYDIVTYGARILRQRAQAIASLNSKIERLADDMLETMYGHSGVGLAAEQIGRDIAICVIDTSPDRKVDEEPAPLIAVPGLPMPLVMINPRIIERSGSESMDEGCLSFPGIYASVARATEITASYLDLKGKEQRIHATGLLARAIQHELDHLGGVLLVDRMSAVKKISLAGQLRKLRAETQLKLNESA